MPVSPHSPVAALERLRARLGTLAERIDLEWVAECASTNSVLSERAPQTTTRPLVLVADHQRAGRGRRGRQWQSWPERSLTFSLQWHFPAGTPAPAGLSLVAGLAVANCLQQLGAIGVQLKWPNDVLINGDKLAGILVELQLGRARSLNAVIGIGLNLALPAATDLEQQRGVSDLARALPNGAPDRVELLALILGELVTLLERYGETGFAPLKPGWEALNAFAQLPVRISGEGLTLDGLCLGVDDDGALLLATEHGKERILSGEVSLRPLMEESR